MVEEKFAVRLFAAFVAIAVSVPAAAAAGPGDGLKAGNLKLHPRLTLSGGYDTNVFRLSEGETPNGRPLRAPVLNISPGLSVTTIDPTNFKLEFDGELTWEQYFSSIPALRRQSGLAGNSDFGLTLNHDGGVSFKVEDNFTYENIPPNSSNGQNFNELTNRVGGVLGIHPGERIFQLDLGYGYKIFRYYTPALLDLDRDKHQFDLDLTWRFLPKTAFVLQGDFDIIQYESPFRGVQSNRVPRRDKLPNVNSMPLKVKGGLSGLLTPRISLRLLGGWAEGFYDTGPSFNGFIAHTSASYRFGQKKLGSKIQLGYERNFKDANISNYSAEHRGFLNFTHNFFDKKFGYTIKGEYVYADYAPLQVGTTEVTGEDGETREFKTVRNRNGELVFLPDDLHDEVVQASVGIHSELGGWWRGDLTYEFSSNLSGDRIDIPVRELKRFRGFIRHYVLASMTFKY
ncbi:MAG: hypothetical protein ABEN55_11010 [Bradymonadaceae bacterium]